MIHGIGIPSPTYFFMLTVSIALASLVLILYQRKYELHERDLYTFLPWSIPSLFIRAKIVFWLQFPEIVRRGWEFWLRGGAALYRGLLRVLVAGTLTSFYYRIPICRYPDGLVLALSLGLVSGWIGCFLAGCNHGQITQQAWGVCFPLGNPAYYQQLGEGLLQATANLSLLFHPTQPYESAFGFSMFCLGLCLLGRRRYQGHVFVTLMAGYGLFRFLVKFLSADEIQHFHVLQKPHQKQPFLIGHLKPTAQSPAGNSRNQAPLPIVGEFHGCGLVAPQSLNHRKTQRQGAH